MFVVYNRTNDAAILKHEDKAVAKQEADKLNLYHNTDNFLVRDEDEAAELAAKLKDHTVNLASGVGTRPDLFVPGAVVDETGKDKYQIANDKVLAEVNRENGGVADHGPITGTAVDQVHPGDELTPAELAAGKTHPTKTPVEGQDESDNEQSVDKTTSYSGIKKSELK